MEKVLNLYKPISQTPLETLNHFKVKFPEYNDHKLAYAGRLDPMANGVLLVLVDEECRNRDDYQKFNKEYEFDFITGIKSDTFDILGEIEVNKDSVKKLSKKQINEILEKFSGEVLQELPPFSSTIIKGNPLYWWAKNKRLHEINIPKRFVKIFDFKFIKDYSIEKEELKKLILERINNVKGDFRQEDIKNDWTKFFEETSRESFDVYKFKAEVSSGTYVRTLVDDIGKFLGQGAITLEILRTKVSDFKLENSTRL